MNNQNDQSNFHFEFEITEEEDRIFRTLVVRNLRALIDKRIGAIVLLPPYFSIVALLCLAVDRGWLSLFAAIVSILLFLVGLYSSSIATLWSARQLRRKLFEESGGSPWRVTFDDTTITANHRHIESRMSWAAIAAVGDADPFVVLWYTHSSGFFIPARMFADSASRSAFAEWATEHARQAALSTRSGSAS